MSDYDRLRSLYSNVSSDKVLKVAYVEDSNEVAFSSGLDGVRAAMDVVFGD